MLTTFYDLMESQSKLKPHQFVDINKLMAPWEGQMIGVKYHTILFTLLDPRIRNIVIVCC